MSVAPVVPADVLGSEPADWPLTIGVALPIPEPFLSELGAYRERFGDPLAHAIVAHITLVPPTEVADEEHLAAILAHLQVLRPRDGAVPGRPRGGWHLPADLPGGVRPDRGGRASRSAPRRRRSVEGRSTGPWTSRTTRT